MSLTKLERRIRIKHRIRKHVSGIAQRPRMSVFRSNKQIYVQLIDDLAGNTLAAVSSTLKEIAKASKGKKLNRLNLLVRKLQKLACKKVLVKLFLIVTDTFIMEG